MWLASEMAAFAHVAELGSFTAAAKALHVPKVAVSRAIASLERRLGARLLNRTTRRVALTPAGTLLRPHCQRLLQEVEAVRGRFATPAPGPRQLRVLVDSGYGRLIVTPLVPRFLEHYADVELHVGLTGSLPSGPDGDWELLVGEAREAVPGVIHTPLGRPPLLLCAAPAYLSRHGHPHGPGELSGHAVLRAQGAASSPPTLVLRRGLEQHTVRLRPALTVDDPALVHSSTAAGLGIGLLPEFLCRQGLSMGKLERVLPDWQIDEPFELAALYPESKAGYAAIRQFLEFLLANMVPVLATESRSSVEPAGVRSDRYQHRQHTHRPVTRAEPD